MASNRSTDHWRSKRWQYILLFNGQAGHAGLFGSVKDLIKLNDLYLKGGVYNHEVFLNEELINQSLENQVGQRGLGWHSGRPFPAGMGHTGFTGTAIWIVPDIN